MITDIIAIKQEISRISDQRNAFLPISREQLGKSFPFGPDGLIIVSGKDGEELIRGVREALKELEEIPLEEVYSFIDSSFLRMDELNVIANHLSFLNTMNYTNGLSLNGLKGGEGRVSILFNMRSEQKNTSKSNHRREGNGVLDIFWIKVAKNTPPSPGHLRD